MFMFMFNSCFLFAKINIVASIAPQKTFIEHIGKDKVNVLVLILPNHSPHHYEPSPSIMRVVSKSDAYFSIGVEFENVWLKKITSQNKNIQIFKTDKNIKKISIEAHNHDEYDDNHQDPHIWLSPDNVKIIAKNILDSLLKLDINNKEFYIKNYKEFINKIIKTDKEIKNNLKNMKNNNHFMVFHPSWGYFAKQYKLSQIAIETQGQNPTAREMISIIKKAKKYNLKMIISNPQTSDKIAKQIAKTLGIKVIRVNHLSFKWAENLIYVSKLLSGV